MFILATIKPASKSIAFASAYVCSITSTYFVDKLTRSIVYSARVCNVYNFYHPGPYCHGRALPRPTVVPNGYLASEKSKMRLVFFCAVCRLSFTQRTLLTEMAMINARLSISSLSEHREVGHISNLFHVPIVQSTVCRCPAYTEGVFFSFLIWIT